MAKQTLTRTERFTKVLRKKLGYQIRVDDIVHDLVEEDRNVDSNILLNIKDKEIARSVQKDMEESY